MAGTRVPFDRIVIPLVVREARLRASNTVTAPRALEIG